MARRAPIVIETSGPSFLRTMEPTRGRFLSGSPRDLRQMWIEQKADVAARHVGETYDIGEHTPVDYENTPVEQYAKLEDSRTSKFDPTLLTMAAIFGASVLIGYWWAESKKRKPPVTVTGALPTWAMT